MSVAMTDPDTLQQLISRLRQASSSEELLLATRQLASCGVAGAAPVLVEVLGFNNPGAAVAAVDGLIALGAAAVPPLLQLDPENYGARAWAVRALAGIGDVRGLDLLVDALGTDVAASVRRAAARGLGNLRLEELEAERRPGVRDCCLQALLAATRDGEWVVRYAVAVGLECLGQGMEPSSNALKQIRQGLVALSEAAEANPPVVVLRARLALSRLPQP
jgi:phycocyanobilin lyase beta subunit